MSGSVDRFQFLNGHVRPNVGRMIPPTRGAWAENIATTICVRVRLPSRSESSRQLHSSHGLVGACPVVRKIFKPSRRGILTRPGWLDRSFIERARHLDIKPGETFRELRLHECLDLIVVGKLDVLKIGLPIFSPRMRVASE